MRAIRSGSAGRGRAASPFSHERYTSPSDPIIAPKYTIESKLWTPEITRPADLQTGSFTSAPGKLLQPSGSAWNPQITTENPIKMADSAPKVAAKERREAASAVDKKSATLVKQITQSKHFIAFTGAGISTSAGSSSLKVLANL